MCIRDRPAPAAKPAAPGKTKPAAPGKAPAKAAPVEDKPAKALAAKPVKADTKAAARPETKGKAAAKPASKTEPKSKGGKKAESPKKGAALVEEEVDLGDIEAELEAEVEAVVVDEKETKAKPLRMKVSRAKERALMREFGLEETTLTEEEATKRRQELKTLIKMGKTRGFLTHQEINDHLPEKLINEEILEAIVSMLNDMGIAVYELSLIHI